LIAADVEVDVLRFTPSQAGARTVAAGVDEGVGVAGEGATGGSVGAGVAGGAAEGVGVAPGAGVAPAAAGAFRTPVAA
jgi:hypothetical protein